MDTTLGAKSRRGKPRGETADESSIDPPNWVALLNEDREAAGAAAFDFGKLGRTLKPLVGREGFEPVRAAWQRWCADTKRRTFGLAWFCENWTEFRATPPTPVGQGGTADAVWRMQNGFPVRLDELPAELQAQYAHVFPVEHKDH